MENFARDLNVHPDYFVPFEARKPKNTYFDHASSLLPKIWRVSQDYFWTYVHPREVSQVVQGWKIHVSTLPERALNTLTQVIKVCVEFETEFKFASDYQILRQLMSKNCSRSAAGKFVTIYPRDFATFQSMLEKLHAALKDEEGPYILSDRQYKDSKVVFYRYGGFKSFSQTDVNGEKTAYILDDKHTYIEDVRQASFHLPEFAEQEFALLTGQATSVDQDNSETEEQNTANYFDGKYEVTSVIKASNAGGVYIAKNIHNDDDVLLKEARPFVGLNKDGLDIIDQLKKEHRLLSKVEHLNIAPKVYGLFKEWKHMFLAQEMIGGCTLREIQPRINRMTHSQSTDQDIQEWVQKLTTIAINVLEDIKSLHNENIVFGDLSTNNIMVDEDTFETRLIDFEGAYEIGVDHPINIFTPGFATFERWDRKEAEFRDDFYALGCTFLSMLLPNTSLLQLNSSYDETFLREMQKDYGIPSQYIEVVQYLLTNEEADLQHCIDLMKSIDITDLHAFSYDTEAHKDDLKEYSLTTVKRVAQYNHNVLDTKRREYVLPVASKMEDPMALDKGILGAVYAWQIIEGSVPDNLTAWVKNTYSNNLKDKLPGLMNGLSGSAWVLQNLGLEDDAKKLLRSAGHHSNLYQKMNLGYGAAGFGLANLHLWSETKNEDNLNQAIKIADILCENAFEHEEGLVWEDAESEQGTGIGLLEGSSGIALFLLYAYSATQNDNYLTAGQKALAYDLSFKKDARGSIGFPRNSKDNIVYPYVAYGSAGVATVALRYYAVTKDEQYLELVNELTRDICHKYTINSGLSTGLAGLGNYLLDAYDFLQDESYLTMATNAVSGLRMFEIQRKDGSAFPDANRSKISADLFDGSAGVALFLNRFNTHSGNKFFMLDELLNSDENQQPA
ncbi:class III lanthionine synthetase LanKC [Pleionea sp. CnH1-48]|uniref:class III lanthionine synthetase LanKC n=1 Tax=Pleionea sp. CnH1-48 TaxID=2954494 RepID=UPI0020983DD7|nr:class III lanthionine synthetase LanKC [Pleionea sp. CnH1-48]MCO7226648.1 class III lanthionine synthetase LanKC [Pleionea sp. CnH1-48]